MLTLKNIESEIEKYASMAEEYQYNFQFDLFGSSCNGDPSFYIKINNQTFYDEKFSGQKTFVIDHVLPKNDTCNIILGLKNKNINNNNPNTVVNNDNKIVKDQYVKILDLKINQISLKKNNLYFWDKAKFLKTGSDQPIYQTDGAYYNGEFILSLPTPIFPFLSKYFNSKIENYNVDKTSLTAERRQELLRTVYD